MEADAQTQIASLMRLRRQFSVEAVVDPADPISRHRTAMREIVELKDLVARKNRGWIARLDLDARRGLYRVTFTPEHQAAQAVGRFVGQLASVAIVGTLSHAITRR